MAGRAERVLTARDLNRALLARQFLLERRRIALPKALERLGGIQAQYAPSMYVGLWTRLAGFERETLTRALERRTVVQGTLLRATIHLVSRPAWWTWSEAVREARRTAWLRYHRDGPGAKEMAAAARRLRTRLADGPLKRLEVQEIVGHGPVGTNGASLWLDLVRVPPSGTWERRRADLFADAERWIGPRPAVDRAGATVALVRAYLRAFCPATKAEIADWAGLTIAPVAKALAELETRRFRSEAGEELFDLPRAPLPDPETPAPVRFLPVWDATLLAHARRTQILPERFRPLVFNTRTPQSANTVLVDGQVAGTWKFVRGSIRVEPFERLGKAVQSELDDEAERLAAFHA